MLSESSINFTARIKGCAQHSCQRITIWKPFTPIRNQTVNTLLQWLDLKDLGSIPRSAKKAYMVTLGHSLSLRAKQDNALSILFMELPVVVLKFNYEVPRTTVWIGNMPWGKRNLNLPGVPFSWPETRDTALAAILIFTYIPPVGHISAPCGTLHLYVAISSAVLRRMTAP